MATRGDLYDLKNFMVAPCTWKSRVHFFLWTLWVRIVTDQVTGI